MKIYKAQIRYNNADSNEWEQIYTVESAWYNSKRLAELHLNELNAFRENIIKAYNDDDNDMLFWCDKPEIIEQEICEEFKHIVDNDFEKYISYKSKDNINIDHVKIFIRLYKYEGCKSTVPLYKAEGMAYYEDDDFQFHVLHGFNGNVDFDAELYKHYTIKSINKLIEKLNKYNTILDSEHVNNGTLPFIIQLLEENVLTIDNDLKQYFKDFKDDISYKIFLKHIDEEPNKTFIELYDKFLNLL